MRLLLNVSGGICYFVGGRAFQVSFEQAIPVVATFIHSLLQGAYHGCACNDTRILFWYVNEVLIFFAIVWLFLVLAFCDISGTLVWSMN